MTRRLVAVSLAVTLAACGRSDLGEAIGGEDVDAGATADASPSPDAAAEMAPRRACVWMGFVAKGTYATGSGPDDIAVSDLNGDGRLDLAVANWGGARGSLDGSVSVFLAKGGGAFAAQVMYPTDIQPGCLAAGDLDGDGRPDVVAANNLSALNVFLTAGDGQLKPLGPAKTVSSVLSLAVADLDGDGRKDLAVANDSRVIDVSFGLGDGTFRESAHYETGRMPHSMVAADIDGDRRLDLVVTNTNFPPGAGLPTMLGASSVNVLRNRGDGTFEPQVVYAAGNGATAVAVGDLDGDRFNDLVVLNSQDGTVDVFLNLGDGSFGAPGASEVGNQAVGLALADLDGDGDLDIVSTHRSQVDEGVVQAFINRGDGTFRPAAPVPVPGLDAPMALATGDFDGDGLPDLAVTTTKHELTILLPDCR